MTSDRSDEREMDSAAETEDDVPGTDRRQELDPDSEGDVGPRDSDPAGEREQTASTEEDGSSNAFQDRYLRLAAEFDNYRKRTERERSESWGRAQAELVKKILDPLDDLQRVADVTVESTGVEALLEGVQMVERKLLRALESAGMEVIDATGQPFDPSLHEALMAAPTDDPEEDETVGQVFQKGYGFKGILLRPARVQVRKHEG